MAQIPALKRSVIRRSRIQDVLTIRGWLEQEKAQGVDGNFLCNWSIIQDCHDSKELLVYVDGDSNQAVAFQLGRLLQTGILQVKNDFRHRGIGTKLVEYCVMLARRKGECLLIVQCTPPTSIPFWERMGFTLSPGPNQDNKAYRVLERLNTLPTEGTPTMVTIRFFHESRKWDAAVRACSEVVVAGKILPGGATALSKRVLFHDGEHPNMQDVVVEILRDDERLFLDKAKYSEAARRGVIRCRNGWSIDRIESAAIAERNV